MSGPAGNAALPSLGSAIRVAVIGASGGIGGALVEQLEADTAVARIYAAARSPAGGPKAARPGSKRIDGPIDVTDEASIAAAAARCAEGGELHLVVVAVGILHDGAALQPEKTWQACTPEGFARSFAVNCTGPALVAKHFLPLLARRRRSVFAALSARVGSIGDNRFGGWYAYRAAKAALNMTLRTLSIELARRNPLALCIGLHPGTVDTRLSEPFLGGVPAGRLFTPQRAAAQLLRVIDDVRPEQTGRVLAWDGREVEP